MLDNEKLSSRATFIRQQFGEDATSPIDVFSMAHSKADLSLFLYPLGEKISGLCVKSEASSLIAINSSMSLGRQRFSLAHEFYHLFFDDKISSSISYVTFNPQNQIEKEANIFASYFLIPSASLYAISNSFLDGKSRELLLEEVVWLEQYFRTSRKAMLARLVNEKLISEQTASSMEINVISSAKNLGYETTLYQPTPEAESKRAYGHYIKKVEALYKEGIISYGKYKEFMLDAFRDDIVYGVINNGGEYVD